MRISHETLSTVLIGLVIGVAAPVARAQQQTQDQPAEPIPAYRSPLASVANNGEVGDSEAQALAPDNRPLAGVQDLSLGVPPISHSYWQPHFDLATMIDSNALNANNSSGWGTWTSLLAGVDLHRISGDNDLTLSYVGGGMISNDGSSSNSVTQGFRLADKVSFRRAALSFFEQLNYSPERFFGYSGLSSLSLPGGGTIGLQPGLTAGQPVLTTNSQIITNTFLTQLDTYLTPRSSLTFSGGYSLLNYLNNGLLNYGDMTFQGGYNYQVSRLDTFAVFYRFNGFRYSSYNQSINDNSIQASYGRRVTGKLAFQVSAGPDVATFQMPLSGSGTGTPTANSGTHVYWSLYSSVSYQLQRTRLGLNYNHGIGGGVGVLAGSITDSVSGSANRQLTRTFNGGVNVGYYRNAGLNVATHTPSTQTIDYWGVGANLNHTMGRALNVSMSYQLQYQTSNGQVCIGTICGQNTTVHLIGLGLSWHDHPIVF
jgi:hypothetical protein